VNFFFVIFIKESPIGFLCLAASAQTFHRLIFCVGSDKTRGNGRLAAKHLEMVASGRLQPGIQVSWAGVGFVCRNYLNLKFIGYEKRRSVFFC
jgi:hypothetical protein